MLSLDPRNPSVLPARDSQRLSYRRLRRPTRLPATGGKPWGGYLQRLLWLFGAGNGTPRR
jgi:hypothetical protein